jgi:hypothetical protein
MKEHEAIPQSYWENERWAVEHASEIYDQYEDVWIAIANQQVVAVGSDPVGVRETAARKTGRTTAEVFVTFAESPCAIYGQDWTLF